MRGDFFFTGNNLSINTVRLVSLPIYGRTTESHDDATTISNGPALFIHHTGILYDCSMCLHGKSNKYYKVPRSLGLLACSRAANNIFKLYMYLSTAAANKTSACVYLFIWRKTQHNAPTN